MVCDNFHYTRSVSGLIFIIKLTEHPAEDGVQIMKIIDAVYTSAKTGELVKL